MKNLNEVVLKYENEPINFQSPNIFNYATSELSQDATLCYFLSGFNFQNHELHEFSRSIIGYIVRKGKTYVGESFAAGAKKYKSIKIQKQFEQIDILITLEQLNGLDEFIIVEDKTNTSHHDDQLLRYTSNPKFENKNLYPIYYKTGYWFPEDHETEKQGYYPINKETMLMLMKPFKGKIQSDIFNNYYEYLTLVEEKETELINYLDSVLGYGKTDEESLSNALITDIGQDKILNGLYRKTRGNNRDGSSWTMVDILVYFEEKDTNPNNLPEGQEFFLDYITWRVDRNNKGVYVSLRQYNKKDFCQEKIERRDLLRKCFERAYENVKAVRRDRMKESEFPIFENGSNRGNFESEIACYYVKDGEHLTMLKELLPSISRELISEIKIEFKEFYDNL